MSVSLHPYREDLPLIYKKEKERILKTIPSIRDIHHAGSTAVKGLSGKNIIDVLIGLDEYKGLEDLTKEFRKLGYITKWIDYKKEWTYLTNNLDDLPGKEFHIHILKKGSRDYEDWFLFRDYLREHKEEREVYAKLKPIWLEESKGVGIVYARLKTTYIKSVIQKARKERR